MIPIAKSGDNVTKAQLIREIRDDSIQVVAYIASDDGTG